MAGKPDLSAATDVQNVVVFVSNDTFARAYAVGQQNVPPCSQNGTYQNAQHPMATVTAKPYSDKQIIKPPDYPTNGQVVNGQPGGYFISQNGFPQPVVNNIGYQNGKNYNEVVPERHSGPGRPEAKSRGEECDNRDGFADSSYVTVMGAADMAPQSVRCDSVRSEAGESSCSSLSSADESMVVVQNGPNEMVVYDPSVSVRPGGVVLTVGPAPISQQTQGGPTGASPVQTQNQQPSILVPYGWKRIVNNGSVFYISPSNAALSFPDEVKKYLQTSGTCKCGLECPFKFDSVFNFDPKVASKPWVLSPDTNQGDLTKLCNHKRKTLEMASLDCKPPDPHVKLRKEFNIKKKRRKIGLPYGGVSVSQILAQRDKLPLHSQHIQQQNYVKDNLGNQQQIWSQSSVNNAQVVTNRLQGYPEGYQQQFIRCQDQSGNRVLAGSPIILGEGMMVHNGTSNPNISHPQQQQMPPQNQPQTQPLPHMSPSTSNPNIHIQQQHIIGPNGQIINVQGPIHQHRPMDAQIQNSETVMMQSQGVMQPHQQRIYVNGQPNEPSGPGRPNVQMIPVSVSSQRPPQDVQRMHHQQQQQHQQPFYNQYQPVQQFDPSKNVRPFGGQVMNGFRPQGIPNNQVVPCPVQMGPQQQKMHWQHRIPQQHHQQTQQQQQPPPNQIPISPQQQSPNNSANVYERVPPLHQPQTVWQEEIKRKKVKMGKVSKNRPYVMDGCSPNHAPCPNIDVRQIPGESCRPILPNPFPPSSGQSSSPSFMEDPSGYLAQQTALLNNTINGQTGANACNFACSSPASSIQNTPPSNIMSQGNEVPLPSNLVVPHMKNQPNRCHQNVNMISNKPQQIPQHIMMNQQQYNVMTQQQQQQQQNVADSSAVRDHQFNQCHGCVADSVQQPGQFIVKDNGHKHSHSRPNSEPGTPSSSGTLEDPVTSSTFSDKQMSLASPDSRPIQGGTVSTSNVSPVDGTQSDPPTPHPHTPTPPQMPFVYSQNNQVHMQQREASSSSNYIPPSGNSKPEMCTYSHTPTRVPGVTTMASGRTVGSNTITSVLAGRANTATVSVNAPSTTPSSVNSNVPTHAITVNVSKSPLEMVQSVVSSIQVPHTQQPNAMSSAHNSNQQQQISPQIIKHSPTGLPPGHILVSSGGQLIMANTGNGNGVMAPPPPKIMANQGGMPPISVSPMITNVTASVTQVIPAVAQQVLGQQTVLVNALPTPSFVLQPGVTMSMDGMTVGQNMQIPQLLAGNVIQQQIQIDNPEARRGTALLSPETKKKGKKRKMSSQTVASMLHIAAQQNSGVMMSQQGFPQQIQMAHSPQGITTGPVMQALTIVPSKNGGPPQIVMNGQAMANTNLGTQQLITNSQPTQQINLLQPVNLINGTTGVVQNFPIQQFILPNLSASMVMNADGTATILQDTSNLGMQLQIQNVNGQNVLTPVQSNVFNGSQNILAAGPAGMVIRAPSSQGKIIQQQQHSPGAQFLSPNGGQFVVNGAQFSGQLSPLVASVSPSQQMTFSTSPQAMRTNNSIQPQQQEYIQCGQTLMVPCAPGPNIAVSSSNQQNTTYVQQNTTIVQQQTTMVSNNQQLQNFQNASPQQQNPQQNVARTTTLNVDQNFIISSNDSKQVQAVVLQRDGPQNPNYRHSVSTQTAVNQNTQSVTTNTFTSTLSAGGSPPDTTTLSPVASGVQSPPTADTTTHSGSTDDGLSPAPSNCSTNCGDINIQGRQQSMAMVHCISSSEPDSAELTSQTLEHDWRRSQPMCSTPKPDYGEITSQTQIAFKKSGSTPTHLAYAESSTLMSGLLFSDHVKSHQQEAVVSSRNYEKMRRKNSEAMIVMEATQMHTSLFEDDEETGKAESKSSFDVGDLVWGPTKGFPAWPGKIVDVDGEGVSVMWFGEKLVTKIEPGKLQTLTEGLDAHHQARTKARTSRKLNTQLENAIQEAMSELDKKNESEDSEKRNQEQKSKSPQKNAGYTKKTSGRLRSSQR